MTLEFDSRPSSNYPHGYWYAKTKDGNHGAVGAAPIDALAALVEVLEGEVAR